MFENYHINNISIDFQSDLIIYPLMMDTQSLATKLWLGTITLGSDVNLKAAFYKNKHTQMKN